MKLNIDAKNVIRNGVPLVVAYCSSSLISKLLKDRLPVPENIGAKIAQRIGLFGISAVVTDRVCNNMVKEVDDWMSLIQPIEEAIKAKKAEKANNITQEDINEIVEKLDNKAQEGTTE